MHGIGNDFVMLDATEAPVPAAETIRLLADRRFGIGCDQVMVAVAPSDPANDLGVRIFNSDGSEAEQCGNGMRCMSVFARDRGLVKGTEIRFELPHGRVTSRLERDGDVSIDMGPPVLEPRDIPFESSGRAPAYELDVDGESLRIGAVSMGNPHAVLPVDDIGSAPVARLGPAVQASARFPAGVNVGFAEFTSRDLIRLRVFERGVGETLACGSGACAAMVVAAVQGRVGARARIELVGGSLSVGWDGGDADTVTMTGPTAYVFAGELAA